MAVLSLMSQKGGCGKTTTAKVLASAFAHKEKIQQVVLIDCDPNAHLAKWWKEVSTQGNIRPESFEKIKVVRVEESRQLIPTIKEHNRNGCVVIVDVPGVASGTFSYAIANSDLIIVPVFLGRAEIDDAKETLAHVESSQISLGYQMKVKTVVGNVDNFGTKETNMLWAEIQKDFDCFETILKHRHYITKIDFYGTILHDLTKKQYSAQAMSQAIAEVDALADEVLRNLAEGIRIRKEHMKRRAEEASEGVLNV